MIDFIIVVVLNSILRTRGARPHTHRNAELYTEKSQGTSFSEFSSCRNMAAIAKDNSSGGSNAKQILRHSEIGVQVFKERAEVLQLIDEICASSVEAL